MAVVCSVSVFPLYDFQTTPAPSLYTTNAVVPSLHTSYSDRFSPPAAAAPSSAKAAPDNTSSAAAPSPAAAASDAQVEGYLFFAVNDATAPALYNTLGWACATYYDRPAEFHALRLRGMGRTARKGVTPSHKSGVQGRQECTYAVAGVTRIGIAGVFHPSDVVLLQPWANDRSRHFQ